MANNPVRVDSPNYTERDRFGLFYQGYKCDHCGMEGKLDTTICGAFRVGDVIPRAFGPTSICLRCGRTTLRVTEAWRPSPSVQVPDDWHFPQVRCE